MKTLVVIFGILTVNFLNAQERDSLSHPIGFLVDFRGTITDQLGVKYRATPNWSVFLRGSISSSTTRISTDPNGTSAVIDTYLASIGLEYVLARVNRVSLFATIAGGITINNSREPWFLPPPSASGYIDDKSSGYSFAPGIGVEYFIVDQLSLSAYQSILMKYSENKRNNPDGTTSTTKTTAYDFAQAKITITFYI